MVKLAKTAVPTSVSPVKRPLRRKRELERDIAHVTEEMYRRNKELADTNRTLSLLRTIDSLVLGSRDSMEVLCTQIASAVAAATDYSFVGILASPGIHAHHHDLEFFGWGTTGELQNKDLDVLRKIKVSPRHRWLSGQEKAALMQLADVPGNKMVDFLGVSAHTLTEIQLKLPLKSVYALKLQARQGLVGVMVVGFSEAVTQIDHGTANLLERLSEAVGIAIDNKLLYEENSYIVNQLKTTNAKLRALDETKDEFISMASHQLRTPLTSVKGYLSMVIEGDAGKINKMQKDLLSQAFVSSQRMVFLIADLLNVSRLKTGKFVIQPVPVKLDEVIEGELAQLKDTAAARKLELSFDKPKDFPVLMLDETKIRQVIMNFLDNAIYYTPSGGHIKTALVDTGKTIECTVTDDGIGVPKKEQHHLFSKFYRAGNAQKARPDGTGLGLFMSQKVVVASGGAIIFKSEEGKGSTFGFSFEKAKLVASAAAAKKVTQKTAKKATKGDSTPVASADPLQ